jgi:CubicO group peptidase (beta-lactamase class C family)
MSDDIQSCVQRILDRMVEQGHTGLQAVVWHRGRLVVDAWAGAPGRGIDGSSLFPIYSTGKGIAATAIHILVQRGTLSWNDRIARWWPEFAANGKQDITLRQALDHTAGMAMLPEHGCMADLADWDGMCRALAAMPPFPAPGSERHYHAITYSWLLGETARRADGRDFGRIIREEIAVPLGLDGLFFGVPEEAMSRVQDVVPEPPRPVQPAAPPTPPDPRPTAIIPARAIPSWVCPLEALMNRTDVRRSCVPASTGIMNARSIARHYAALVGDGIDGIRLLSDATLDEAVRSHPITGETRARWGLGYGLSGPDNAPGAVFGHGGYGGSNGWADRRHALAFGFTTARMGADSSEIANEVRRCLGCP